MDFNNDTGSLSNVSSIVPTGNTVAFSGTGGIVSMAGTSSERPISPTVGTYRYNSDITDMEFWNGSNWIPFSGSNSVISFLISGWTLQSGNRYYANITHNLNSLLLSVTLWNTATSTVVLGEIVAIDANTLRIYVTGNTRTIRAVVVSAGTFTGYTNSNQILRTLTYFAPSLDSPNSSDWALNSLAPTISDPDNPALTVRRFSNTVSQGVGFMVSVPAGATNVTFRFKGRAQTAPALASVVQPVLYVRSLASNSPIGSWSSGIALNNIAIPTNKFVQYSSQTLALASAGLTENRLHQVELCRSTTVSGGTQLLGFWLLSEITIEFT